MFKKRMYLVCLLMFCGCATSLHTGKDQNPGVLKPIQMLEKYYSTDMLKVAEVVTSEFRDGKSKAEWAEETTLLLDSIGYERLDSKIQGQIIAGDSATVIARTTIYTAIVQVRIDEIFHLTKEGDEWLIDEMEFANQDTLQWMEKT